MKQSFITLFSMLALLLTTGALSNAQSPPGWGWVNQIGTYVPNATSENKVAGLGRDAAGNIYLLGTTASTPPIVGAPPGSQGGSDIFLTKYDPAGTVLWQRTLQSSGDDAASALVVEPSGRCTLAGYYGFVTGDNLSFASFNNTTAPLAGPALLGLPTAGSRYQALTFVASVDANGNLLWANTPSPVYGGVNVTALHRDGAGNSYVSANANPQSQLTVGGQNYPPVGTYDAVLIKYSVAGQPVWARRVGASGGFTFGGEIKTDDANALYWLLGHSGPITIDQSTVGVTSATGGNSLVKISAANRVKWVKNDLLRVSNDNAVGQLLGFDSASNALYISGYSNGGAITASGGIAPVAVVSNARTSCVARCDTAGQVQWVKPVFYSTNVPGGLPGLRGAGIQEFKVRSTGFSLVTRTVEFNATAFYGSARTYGLAEGGLQCVLHFNTTSNQTEWVRVGGTPSTLAPLYTFSETKGAVIDVAGNAFLAGSFKGTAQFGATTLTSTSTTQPEIFLAKLDQAIPTGTKAGAAGLAWSVYPNPAAGTAQLAGLPAAARVRVYDGLGRLVRELPAVASAAAPRTLGGLAPGLYLLQVTNTPAPYRSQRLVMQ